MFHRGAFFFVSVEEAATHKEALKRRKSARSKIKEFHTEFNLNDA
jgi:hypothetical protein